MSELETVSFPRIEVSDDWAGSIDKVRGMIVIAIGCLKELSSQAVMKYKAPGMRFLIGEIMSCLAQAKAATNVNPLTLNK